MATYRLHTNPIQAAVIALADRLHRATLDGRLTEAALAIPVHHERRADTAVAHARDRLTLAEALVDTSAPYSLADVVLPAPEDAGDTLVFTLDERQARRLLDALEIVSRLHLGQFWVLFEALPIPRPVDHERRDRLRILFDEVGEALTGLSPGANWGVHNPAVDDEARVAWDLKQVVRNRLAWDRNPAGDITVDFDPPFQSSRQPLASIERVAPAA